MKFVCVVSCVLTVFASYLHAADSLDQLQAMSESAVSLVDAKGRVLISKRPDEKFVPASTVKLITALAALDKWGVQHRFSTQFYLDRKNKILIVKGLGDPFLVSEELDVIVEALKRFNLKHIHNIVADVSYFDTQVNISEQGKTNNPYDAASSALAANFNSIGLKVESGQVKSAEVQTPITPIAKQLAKTLPNGKHRINLGLPARSSKYFIEVLTAKLREAGVIVDKQNDVSSVDMNSVSLLFTHSNSKTLEFVVQAMLEYSNNFIASQLFLLLGAEQFGGPANLAKAQQAMTAFIEDRFAWEDYEIRDGAGLSRSNRLSANQLIEVLQAFKPYRLLMPQQEPNILAKSGTLRGVSCYAGFVYRNDEWQSFALLVNQPVKYRFRERVAQDLLNY